MSDYKGADTVALITYGQQNKKLIHNSTLNTQHSTLGLQSSPLIHGGDIEGYRLTYGGEPLDFSANCNPLGLPPAVRRAILAAADEAEHYPDPLCRRLTAAIAHKEGLAPEQVLCGNGAADLIYRLALALKPALALIPTPTFTEYELALHTVGCAIRHYPLTAQNGFNFMEDILGHLDPQVDILFLCNPNNPTGITIAQDLLQRILQHCAAHNILLVMDECFNGLLNEPARHTLRGSLCAYRNLLILDAFTKLYAMAGLRLGYALSADMELLTAMRGAGQPWAVSSLAQAAGVAALTEELYLQRSRALISGERAFLSAGLTAAGFTVLDGEANFLFFHSNIVDLAARLRARGILIRDCANYTGLTQGYYRVAVKNRAANQRLLAAIKAIIDDEQKDNKANSTLITHNSSLITRAAKQPVSGAILCIVDGMCDENFRAEDYRHLAALKAAGAHGAFITVPPGFTAESYPCIAILLGVAAEQLPPLARGYLEALGAEIAVEQQDLVLRASWMQVDEDNYLCGTAQPPGIPMLPPGCDYYELGSYKALLVLRGAASLLPNIITFAPHACIGQPLTTALPTGEARLTEIVLSSRIAGRVLIPWGESIPCHLPALSCRAAAVGAAYIMKGIARAMGMDVYDAAGFTGDTDTDLAAKTQLALELAERYPMVLLHINGADEAAHRRDSAQKRLFMRQVDEIVLAALRHANVPALICSDHGTSPVTGRHMAGEQPFVLTGTTYRGDLGCLPGNAAMQIVNCKWQIANGM